MSPDVRRLQCCFIGAGGTLGGGIGGTGCGFSTYYDGSTEQNVDFNETTGLPETGVSIFTANQYLQDTSTTAFDASAEWTWVVEDVTINSSTSGDGRILRYTASDGSIIAITYDFSDNRIQFTIFNQVDNRSLFIGSIGDPIPTDTPLELELSSTGGTSSTRTMTAKVTGFSDATYNTLDYSSYADTGGSFLVAGTPNFYGSIGDMTLQGLDDFSLNTRVQAQDDPDLGNIVGSVNGNVLTPSVDRSYMYPYYNSSQYLVEDVPCEGDAFLTSGGAFMTSNGVPMVRGVFAPGYTKDVFI
jgi:hypothetical protein